MLRTNIIKLEKPDVLENIEIVIVDNIWQVLEHTLVENDIDFQEVLICIYFLVLCYKKQIWLWLIIYNHLCHKDITRRVFSVVPFLDTPTDEEMTKIIKLLKESKKQQRRKKY